MLKDCFNYLNNAMGYKNVRNFVFAITAILTIILACGILAQVSGNWQNVVGKVMFFIIMGLSCLISFCFTIWGCLRCNSGYDEIPHDIDYV